MKTCSKCGSIKSHKAFNKRTGAADGLQARCRECNKAMLREHYAANTDAYKQRRATARMRLTEQVRLLKEKPCVDCGNRYHPAAMDFDHRDASTKMGSVANLLKSCWKLTRILDEIAKCDLVCANCHRVRTFNRNQAGVANRKSSKRFV